MPDYPIVIAEFALIILEEGVLPELQYSSRGLVGPLTHEEINVIFGKLRDMLVKELVEGGVLRPEGAVIN